MNPMGFTFGHKTTKTHSTWSKTKHATYFFRNKLLKATNQLHRIISGALKLHRSPLKKLKEGTFGSVMLICPVNLKDLASFCSPFMAIPSSWALSSPAANRQTPHSAAHIASTSTAESRPTWHQYQVVIGVKELKWLEGYVWTNMYITS